MKVIYELCTEEEMLANQPGPRWFCWISCGKCKKRFLRTDEGFDDNRPDICPFCCATPIVYGMDEKQRIEIYEKTDGLLGQKPRGEVEESDGYACTT